jgi:Methyltransferase domain
VVGFKKAVRNKLNILLGPVGFQLLRPGERDHIKSYQPFKRTLEAARRAGLSVGDYIDSKFQVPGATQATIDRLCEFGVFDKKIQSVCEIGPGSGRYLEKVQRLCAPQSYEIYEPEQEWSDWLERTYAVTAHESDGRCLGNTANNSVDLVHAHKVFVCLLFVVACQYFDEMIRVTRPGGQIVFDIVSESCMPDTMLEKWISSTIIYPCMLPRNFVTEYFTRKGCSLRSSFFAPMMPGQSEYLVIAKEQGQKKL